MVSGAALRGFYDATDARLSDVRRPPASVVFGEFYSFPAELIAEWCAVSVETARKWKNGDQQPSRSALKLFRLHAARRVLAAPAWDGWSVRDDRILDPEGNETTQGQLRAYYLVYQHCRELAKRDCDATAELERLMRMAG